MGTHKKETRKRLNTEYRERHREKLNKAARDLVVRLREEVLSQYGECCQICGFDKDKRVLQIDHINNDGYIERKSLGGRNFSGKTFYLWLRKQGYPEGYQTLCANCNLIKYYNTKEITGSNPV